MSSFYGGGGGGGLSKKDLDAITSKIFKFKIVTSLPTEDISDSTIYLINTGEEEDNFYTEYVYVDNNWEKFGTQKVDLSNYVASQDLTLALETKADKSELPVALSDEEVEQAFGEAVGEVYSSGNDFVVTYTDTGEENGAGTGRYILECDKTVQEIQEAYTNGKTIKAKIFDEPEDGYDYSLLTLCRARDEGSLSGFEFFGIDLQTMMLTPVFHYDNDGDEISYYSSVPISTT